jgi:hypothetical protein
LYEPSGALRAASTRVAVTSTIRVEKVSRWTIETRRTNSSCPLLA